MPPIINLLFIAFKNSLKNLYFGFSVEECCPKSNCSYAKILRSLSCLKTLINIIFFFLILENEANKEIVLQLIMLCCLVIYRFYFRIFKSSGEYTIKPNFPSHRCWSIRIDYCFWWFWEELFTYLLLKYILYSLHSADITFCVHYSMFAPFLNEVNGKHCFCNVYLVCHTRIFFYLHWLRKFYEGPRISGGIEIAL